MGTYASKMTRTRLFKFVTPWTNFQLGGLISRGENKPNISLDGLNQSNIEEIKFNLIGGSNWPLANKKV